MSAKPNTKRPLFLVKTGSISAKDIQRVERLCGICIIEIANVYDGHFVTQPPVGDTSMQARAAMDAMLMIASHKPSTIDVEDIVRLYTKLSIEGKPNISARSAAPGGST